MSNLNPGLPALLLLTLFLALLLMPAAAWLARRTGFVDRPSAERGGRKQHKDAIPPVGGLVIFPAFMLVTALGGVPPDYIWFFAALGLLLVTGALD